MGAPRGFGFRLGLVVAAAVALRAVHTIFVAPATSGLSDSFWYSVVAKSVSAGHGFEAFVGEPPLHAVATAEHPPAYPLMLALADTVGITGDTGQRLLGAVCGGGTVLAVGLLGRRIGGPALGLTAVALAAVHPLLIAADGSLLSETLYGPVVAFTLLAAWHMYERPSAARAALVGAGVGLAGLTRSEAVLLLPLLALPLAWRGGSGRWLRIGCAVAATAVVMSPWVVRNWIVFDRPVLSTNDGALIAWTNCDRTYYGEDIGYLVPECADPVTGNEAQQAAKQSRQGIDYARDHASRFPLVAAARLLGTWSLFKPFSRFADPGRNTTVLKIGVVYFYALLALAVLGALALRRRPGAWLVLGAPILTVCLVAVATYSSIRLRFLAEIPLVVLAAAGAQALFDRLRTARN